jgi:hypothetical protein
MCGVCKRCKNAFFHSHKKGQGCNGAQRPRLYLDITRSHLSFPSGCARCPILFGNPFPTHTRGRRYGIFRALPSSSIVNQSYFDFGPDAHPQNSSTKLVLIHKHGAHLVWRTCILTKLGVVLMRVLHVRTGECGCFHVVLDARAAIVRTHHS